MLILLTVHNADAEEISGYLITNGGGCMTYKDTLPGTLVTFEPCKWGSPKHGSWGLALAEDAFAICIVGTDKCIHVDDEGIAYLKKKDLTDLSQIGTISDAWPDRFHSNVFGPNFCFQAMRNHHNGGNYFQLQRCNLDNANQILLTYIPEFARAFANRFRYAASFRNPFQPFPYNTFYTHY